MSKTILLRSTTNGQDKKIILSGDTIQIVNGSAGAWDKYRLDSTDTIRLLMFCEETIKRRDQNPKVNA